MACAGLCDFADPGLRDLSKSFRNVVVVVIHVGISDFILVEIFLVKLFVVEGYLLTLTRCHLQKAHKNLAVLSAVSKQGAGREYSRSSKTELSLEL